MVSIIIPVYNGEKYIDNILNCLYALDHNDFEAIFINDGSADDSLSKLLKASMADRRIKVFSQENKGVSAARNLGLEKANGDYIAFVDVDDEICENYLSLFLNFAHKTGAEALFCQFSYTPSEIPITDPEIKIYNKNELLSDMLYRKVQIGVCGMFVKRELIDKNALRFKSGYKYSEDLHMTWRIFNCSEKTVYIKAPLYVYRQNEGSAMTKLDVDRLDSVRLMEDLIPYFERTNKEFAPEFKRYAVPRIAWATLWQAAAGLDYKGFVNFVSLYDYKSDFKKLYSFPDKKVKLSARLFVFSKRMYYHAARYWIKNMRAKTEEK